MDTVYETHNIKTKSRDPVELYALYSSRNIIQVIKLRRMRWVGHVVPIGGRRAAYRVLVGRPGGRRPLGRSRPRWEDNVKTALQEVGWVGMDSIALVQDTDKWRALVNAVMKLRGP
jgi:hypothetical protein